jgi:mannitol-1-phosphate 5-dehydrogenase
VRLVQFGAGNIGRGFIAPLFAAAGWEVLFVEVAPEMLAALRERGSYPLERVGPRRFETVRVRGVRAIDGRDREAVAAAVAAADAVGTAVGAAALPHIAAGLAAGLARRDRESSPLNIFMCENERHVARQMAGWLADARVRGAGCAHWSLVETVVSCMVPALPPEERARDPLRVVVEDYDRLPVDARAIVGVLPAVPGLEAREDFDALVDRKLFVHNMAHAVAAYRGYLSRHAFVHEAIADPEIEAVVRDAMEEACAALVRRHRLGLKEQTAYRADLLLRFANPRLRDTLTRVGRDPLRKLRREDRLVGAALLCLEEGVTPRAIASGIAAALRFDAPDDPSAGLLQSDLQERGPDAVFADRCGVPADHPLTALVRAAGDELPRS